MMKWIETTGKNEEEAIQKALRELGLDRDEVSVEILERAKSGFLGIGSTPAKIKVTYEAADEAPAPAPAAQPASTSAARYAAIIFLFWESKNMYAATGAAIRQTNAIASRPAVTFMTASSTSESAAAVRQIIPTGSVPLPSTELLKSSHSFPASSPFCFPLFSLMHISAFPAPKTR